MNSYSNNLESTKKYKLHYLLKRWKIMSRKARNKVSLSAKSLVLRFRREAVNVTRKLLHLGLGEEDTYPSCPS